jgi:hypothetical protein
MAKPKDSAALECYRQVLLNFGHVQGFIEWERLPYTWLRTNLPNVNARQVHQLMIAHVASGGEIDQVEERRPEYVAWKFHYDLRLPISGRKLYIETVFEQADDPEDCTIHVVNVHDQ